MEIDILKMSRCKKIFIYIIIYSFLELTSNYEFIGLNDSPSVVGIGVYSETMTEVLGKNRVISLISNKYSKDLPHPGVIVNGVFPPLSGGWRLNHEFYREILKRRGHELPELIHYLSSWFIPPKSETEGIVTVEDVHWKKGGKKSVFKGDRRFIAWDNIIANSELTKKDMVLAGFKEECITVIHHPIPDFWHRVHEPPSSENPNGLINSIGNKVDINRLNLEDRPIVLTVKDGPHRNNNLVKNATKGRYFHIHVGSDVKADVNFVNINTEVLRYLYSIADVYVRVADSEGFGYPPLEALMCGTPSVVSDLPTYRETMGESAIYVQKNENAIILGINEAIQSKKTYLKKFDDDYRSHFSKERFKNDMQNYYRERGFKI